MVLVNGGYLHCTDKEIIVNSSLKGKKRMVRVISKTQVSDPGPSWPSCFAIVLKLSGCIDIGLTDQLTEFYASFNGMSVISWPQLTLFMSFLGFISTWLEL